MELKTFRHEYKYAISYDEMLNLRAKLNELLTIDRDYNGYLIRSLYFDSINDNDYYDKLGGEMNRKKIRLRIYGTDEKSIIKLEIKAKYDYHQLKESLILKKEDAKKIIQGDYSVLLSYDSKLALKLYSIMRTNYYKPKVIIEYNRIAYMTKNDTRVTFDYNIRKSNDVENFFNERINYLNISNAQDVVLEVKFNYFLEPYISNVLSKYVVRYQSFSKYVLGRNIL